MPDPSRHPPKLTPRGWVYAWTPRGWVYVWLQGARGYPLNKFMRELEAMEQLAPEELARRCEERLRSCLAYARDQVPLYGSGAWVGALAPRTVRLETWPVLERDVLRSRLDELIARHRQLTVTRRTSGSSGTQLKIKLSPHAEAWGWAHRYRGLLWHGIPIGVRSLRISHHLRPMRDFLLDQYCVPDLEKPDAIDKALKFLTTMRPPLVTGPPSMLFYLARRLRERGVDAPLAPFARVGGEQLFRFQRAEIEKHLCTRVINSYGCTELGAVAGECPAGSLHVYSDHVHLEIFQGASPAEVGEFGDIVLTSLRNPVMPLVRYRVGDRGRLSPERCPCGLPQPVLQDLQARAADTFQSTDGESRHGSELVSRLSRVFEDPVSDLVRQAQFEQVGMHGWRVWLVIPEGQAVGDALAERLAGIVREVAGRGCEVEVRAARSLPRERGKFFYYRLQRQP